MRVKASNGNVFFVMLHIHHHNGGVLLVKGVLLRYSTNIKRQDFIVSLVIAACICSTPEQLCPRPMVCCVLLWASANILPTFSWLYSSLRTPFWVLISMLRNSVCLLCWYDRVSVLQMPNPTYKNVKSPWFAVHIFTCSSPRKGTSFEWKINTYR